MPLIVCSGWPSEDRPRSNANGVRAPPPPHPHRYNRLQGFDIRDSKSKLLEAAIVLTATGADIETGGVTP